MYWVLHLFIVKDVRGHTNSTCVKLRILSTCVLFSPAGSIITHRIDFILPT